MLSLNIPWALQEIIQTGHCARSFNFSSFLIACGRVAGVCVCVCARVHVEEVRVQLAGVGSFLPPCESPGWNSGHQDW